MWPKHFPKGCPSNDITDVDGEVFRLIRTDRITTKDMRSHAEKCKLGCDYCRNTTECQRASLSSLSSLEDALCALRVSPLFNSIAKADLAPEHGKRLQTNGPGHYSLWLRDSALSHALELFAIVPSEDDV